MSTTRSGKGEEQFGNTVGIPFICPLGCKHGGSGYCTYVGDYRQGLFHGYGELKCMSGLWYKGQFRRGKKEGQVCIDVMHHDHFHIFVVLNDSH
jgi:hypothetical protein